MRNFLFDFIKSYTKSYKDIPAVGWFGLIINFIQTISAGIFYFLSYFFVHYLKYDVKTSGMIISCYGLGAIFGGVIGGKLSDKYVPNWISISSLVIESASFISFVYSKNIAVMFILTFILGVTNYSFMTTNYLWILSKCEESQAIKLRAINLLSVISNLGLGVSAVIFTIIPVHYMYYLFYTNFVVLLSLALLLIAYEFKNYGTDQAVKCISSTLQIHASERNKFNLKILTIILGCVFCIGLIISQMSTTYSLYLKNMFPEYGLSGFSLIFIINTFLVVAFQAPIGEAVINKNPLVIVGLGSLLLGFGMGVMAITPFFSIAIVACIVYTVGEMIFFSMAQLICYEKAPEAKKGQHMGIYRMIFASSRVLGPFLGASIYVNLGGDMVWYACATLGGLCFVVCMVNKKMC